jgi:formylmethanofuran dehydrogenase subunit E
LTTPKQETQSELKKIIRKAKDWHGHLGPFLALGVRMGLIGMRELGAKRGHQNLRVTVMTKPYVPFSCVVDGIQAATKCTIGNRRLKLRNSPKNISARFQFNTAEVVVALDTVKREELEKLVSKRTSLKELEKVAWDILSMSEKELFKVERSNLRLTARRRTLLQLEDLETARERLKQKNLALVIVKNGRVVFETSSHGIGGLLRAIEVLNGKMKNSVVADKVVGKAAALLCVYAEVFAVFAVTASEKAIQALKVNKVLYRFENRVPHILNSEKSDICPFEKLVINLSNPKEAYEKLKTFAVERRLI